MTLPEPSLCEACHNGQTVRRVDWTPPPQKASNLDFNHVRVLAAKREAMGIELPCASCHAGKGGRMDVRRANSDVCLGCHAQGKEHRVDAPCEVCHVPLAQARGLTVAQLREFPVPPDHAEEDFLWNHGSAASASVARCAVCHARELCSSCHVNAPSVPAIQALAPDPRAGQLAAERTVVYPTPESHRAETWWETHGAAARSDVTRCETCHTRTSCRSCHVEPGPEAVRRLPSAPKPRRDGDGQGQERGPGVTLERRPPASHVGNFLETHRVQAAGATAQCHVCHARTECLSCHTGSEALNRPGERAGSYHVANFLQQHSAAAFGRQNECATCHNPEAFCRSCHLGQGLGSDGRIDTGFHDRKPNWVFGHGQAARQGLESCATCHSQRDCLQCHSALGGRRISPHGPDFDAERLRQKNPAMCLRCHRRSILEP